MSVELLAPKVFISYSHDSQRHKDFVLELANRLRSGGVDANIDQYEESPAEGWQRWMLKQIEASTFVLVVCTEQYYRRFCGHEEIGTGRGVTWEGGIILQEIYDAQARNSKFIPVVISPQDSDFIPNPLRSSTIYCLTLSDRYDALYRRLTNQQEIQRPELGPIELLPPRKRQQFFLNQDEHNRLKEALFNASQGLLEWRRVLGNGQCILRPELRNLQNRIETVDSSTTIILGDSGSGKSTLMADLGHWSVFKQYALLAIKSDYLSNTINAIEDLQRDLQVDRCLEEAIKAIANTEKIILLVDQLDAISDLLDRKSQRLNLLLSLIQRLSGHKNIHIIATCREFEFRYGSQFSRLDSIDQLGLALPTWDAIAPILETAGHLPANMGDSLRELLQTPLHLKIFLDVAHPGEVFTSSQNLLNRLWEEQVLKQSEPSQCIAFLENLANEMTENEVLWLPSAFSDTNPEISRILESAGLLISNPGNSTIGFRHQTYYDYTLARAFARGTQSLTDRVLGNQDGLFIRPVLLRGLSYLRGTAPHQYRQQIVNLVQTCQSQIRSHIRSLLIGFIGSQREPNAAESELMIPLLISEQEGIKMLESMVGSPGWFRLLRTHSEFVQWLEKPIEQTVYCVPLLTVAASFASEDVWSLLEEYWLENQAYDHLSIRIAWSLDVWTAERVDLIQKIVQRTPTDWHAVAAIAEKIAEEFPDLAAQIIRAYLDQRLAQATAESQIPPPELPPDADDVQRYMHAYKYDSKNPLKRLLEGGNDLYEIDKFAQDNPKSFLNSNWPWLVCVVDKIAPEPNSKTTSYRDDYAFSLDRHNGEILEAFLIAILTLAEQDMQGFISFFQTSLQSDLLLAHRLLARGLEKIGDQEPKIILDYLLDDPRRLSLGSSIEDQHHETKHLISRIYRHLSVNDREKLSRTICEFDYYYPGKDDAPDIRFQFLKYNRQYRLRLLLAIPADFFSPEIKKLKNEEIRAFPWVVKEDQYATGGVAFIIGPRVTKTEMSRASDQDLMNLFDKLSDNTGWDFSRRSRENDLSRSGGLIQQARAFGELVKDNPSRFIRLIPSFIPQQHESYAGAALKALADTEFSAQDLLSIVQQFNQQGFDSEDFRSDAAHTLQKIATYNRGLPSEFLDLLRNWLINYSKPELTPEESQSEKSSNSKLSIVFGTSHSHFLVNGRGSIVRAIAG
jgi:hypothetical protein